MTRTRTALAILLILACAMVSAMSAVGAAASRPPASESGSTPAVEVDTEVSVQCLPFGLCGTINGETLVTKLSESSEDLIFVGTSSGLHVIGLDGKLRRFLYTPFGVHFVETVGDITGDGIRDVVVALNDTQVPALRCYDGATWKKLWQFAPAAKVWDRVWVVRQMSVTSLEVIDDGNSQAVLIVSGRRVFSVNAGDGAERWRSEPSNAPVSITAVGDLDGDGTEEGLLTEEVGFLCSLDGNTGKVRWRTKLPEYSEYGTTTQSQAGYVLPVDREAGLVAVASSDGFVRLFDLNEERVQWEVPLASKGNSPGSMTLVPDATPDGQPGILVPYFGSTASAYGGGSESKPRTALLDTAGRVLWDKDIDAWDRALGSSGGRQVIILSTAQEIRLLDVSDGESSVKTVPITTLSTYAQKVRQIGVDAFLLVQDMTTVASSGDVLWHYPRIGNIEALHGHFVGDGTEDILFSAELANHSQSGYVPSNSSRGIILKDSYSGYSQQAPEPEVGLLKMMDGATGEFAWSYEVPYSDLISGGGLKGVEMTPDLVGNDGVQDIISYREDTVFVFSGKDGTLLSTYDVGQSIASLDVIRNGTSGNAVLVGTADGLMIFDSAGSQIWAAATTDWLEDNSGTFTTLDDINSDGISDLAVLSPARIVLLRSTDNGTAFETHRTFKPRTDSEIEYVELIPDVNGDGVRELAYIERNPGSQQPDNYEPPGCPLLIERSPVDGKQLLKLALPGSHPAIDLSFGDFDGDACDDLLICSNPYEACGGPTDRQIYDQKPGAELKIVSGIDGKELWTHFIAEASYSLSGWGTRPPAALVGDINGDGKDDLAWTVDRWSPKYTGQYCNQRWIEIYDVAQDRSLKEVTLTPAITDWGSGETTALVPVEVDIDGHLALLAAVSEPLLSSSFLPSVAVVDMDTEERLATFMGFRAASISVFESHKPGVLGAAASGGVYYLNTDACLEVSSPVDGTRTGPIVGIRWEDPSEGGFAQVFVDGVRNYRGNDPGVDLYLARGEHDVLVWSVDDHGRILYGPPDLGSPVAVRVTPSPWKPVLLLFSLFALLFMIGILFYSRLHRVWRARRRETKPQRQV